MSTLKTNIKRATLLSLGAIALFMAVPAADAQAGIRVRAQVHTPIGTVGIASGSSVRYREVTRRTLPVRRCIAVRVTARDRRIARRLARYTGVRRTDLLDLKRQGYSWTEIGRWLDLSPRAVRAASSRHGWHKFLARTQHGAPCRVACCDQRRVRRGHH